MLIDEKINALAMRLGFTFREPQLFVTALTHRSFVHENPSHPTETYQRLEFLGDSVLSLIVTEELFRSLTTFSEGQLSKLRSAIVNEETLAQLARRLELDSFMFVGKGEAANLHTKDSVMADALESLLGAIYLDQGFEVVKKMFHHWISDLNLFDGTKLSEFDAKSRLQEYCMKQWQELPAYEFEEKRMGTGVSFRVTLKVHGRELLCSQNVSKKKAELWLAQTCLQQNLHLTLSGG